MTNDIEKVGPSIEQEFQKALEQGIDNGYEEILDSELTFKPKDKIIYFLFEGFCNGLQEITLENYEGDDLENSEFFYFKFSRNWIRMLFLSPWLERSIKEIYFIWLLWLDFPW